MTVTYHSDDDSPVRPQLVDETPSPVPGAIANNAAAQLVFDVVAGPNLRVRDNLYQAVAIFVGVLLGALAGWQLSPQDLTSGLIFGGAAGLLVGLFGSGIFLMIWRLVAHLRGRHD